MEGPLSHAAMADHAREQTDHGRRLLAAHMPDGTGCCKRCGRSHPCADRQQGEDLVAMFAEWLEPPR